MESNPYIPQTRGTSGAKTSFTLFTSGFGYFFAPIGWTMIQIVISTFLKNVHIFINFPNKTTLLTRKVKKKKKKRKEKKN